MYCLFVNYTVCMCTFVPITIKLCLQLTALGDNLCFLIQNLVIRMFRHMLIILVLQPCATRECVFTIAGYICITNWLVITEPENQINFKYCRLRNILLMIFELRNEFLRNDQKNIHVLTILIKKNHIFYLFCT